MASAKTHARVGNSFPRECCKGCTRKPRAANSTIPALQHRAGGHGVRVRTREIWRKDAPDVATECSGVTHHFFAADFFAFFGAGAAAAFFAIAAEGCEEWRRGSACDAAGVGTATGEGCGASMGAPDRAGFSRRRCGGPVSKRHHRHTEWCRRLLGGTSAARAQSHFFAADFFFFGAAGAAAFFFAIAAGVCGVGGRGSTCDAEGMVPGC